MKRAILLLLIGAVLGGGAVWLLRHGGGKDADEKPAAAEEESKTSVTRDGDGNVVVNISDEKQGDAGIVVTNPFAAQWSPELKGYGRVIDPAPLAALVTELAAAEATYAASSNELARVKTLAGQANASPRALQTAEAAALRDQLAAQSAKDRLALAWGPALANRDALPAFSRTLTSLDALLVRIDVPAGETISSTPAAARIVTLGGATFDADFLGAAATVDAQLQGRGFLFLVPTNSARVAAGEAVTGYLKIPGEPLSGVIVPRKAVVRAEGRGWVYVLNENGESFTRREIPLDRPTENGWFVAGAVTPAQYLVVTGAQTLLSEESKASMSAD